MRTPAKRFSTLAGFVEPGESLEDAVVREVFEESVAVLAKQLAASAADKVAVSKETILQKLWLGRGELNSELKKARKDLAERLASRAKFTMDRLIELHDLEGQSAAGFAQASAENFAMPETVSEPLWTAVGGFAAGASGGMTDAAEL